MNNDYSTLCDSSKSDDESTASGAYHITIIARNEESWQYVFSRWLGKSCPLKNYEDFQVTVKLYRTYREMNGGRNPSDFDSTVEHYRRLGLDTSLLYPENDMK